MLISLERWFPNCGLQISSLSITWEVVRNAPSDPQDQKLGGGACFNNPWIDSETCSGLRTNTKHVLCIIGRVAERRGGDLSSHPKLFSLFPGEGLKGLSETPS